MLVRLGKILEWFFAKLHAVFQDAPAFESVVDHLPCYFVYTRAEHRVTVAGFRLHAPTCTASRSCCSHIVTALLKARTGGQSSDEEMTNKTSMFTYRN